MMENNFNESIDILQHNFNSWLVMLKHLYAGTLSLHFGLQTWLDIEWSDIYTIKGTTGDG